MYHHFCFKISNLFKINVCNCYYNNLGIFDYLTMKSINKIGIIQDDDFALKNLPPYPYPTFYSYENPLRIKAILDYLKKNGILEDERIIKIAPMDIEEEIICLAHTKYHVESIKAVSSRGSGLFGEEVFITEDTFNLAKKAIGGAISAVKTVIDNNHFSSLAFIRPPGHHALREKASGLCIFNNIATAVLFLREKLHYQKKIAIVDIDAHFGDGLVQYFYDDPSVLYFSVHEYDFVEGEIGFIDELGTGEGLGKSVNFPIPFNSTDDDFLECFDILEPILKEFLPDLIIVAAGFDMYFADPIGNCLLTSKAYYEFTKRISRITREICHGRLTFILEGGYSLIGLPACIHSLIQSLLNVSYERPNFEYLDFNENSKKEDIIKIKSALKTLLANHWNSIE
jgi:acetoin utilization deacetylase AcuC-like enzyme